MNFFYVMYTYITSFSIVPPMLNFLSSFFFGVGGVGGGRWFRELDDLSEIVLQDIIYIKIAYKMDIHLLISRLNVANLEFC